MSVNLRTRKILAAVVFLLGALLIAIFTGPPADQFHRSQTDTTISEFVQITQAVAVVVMVVSMAVRTRLWDSFNVFLVTFFTGAAVQIVRVVYAYYAMGADQLTWFDDRIITNTLRIITAIGAIGVAIELIFSDQTQTERRDRFENGEETRKDQREKGQRGFTFGKLLKREDTTR